MPVSLESHRRRLANARHVGAVRSLHPRIERIAEWDLLEPLERDDALIAYRARPVDQGDHPTSEAAGDYVVRTVRDEAATKAFARARLRRHAEAAQDVAHSHVVSVLACSLESERPFVVEPFAGPVSLADVVARGPMPEAAAIWYVRQIADAVGACHAAHWLASNLLPSVVRVSLEGHTTLTNLGFARRQGTDECLATDWPRQLDLRDAPELRRSAGEWTEAADVYALGLLLLEMLLGGLPFDARTADRFHATASPAALLREVGGFSADVVQLVGRFMAKEPLRRPTAAEAVDWLIGSEISQLSA